MSFESMAVGIDLGMRYSCAGVWLPELNRVEMIDDEEYCTYNTPSYVSFTESECVVGGRAFEYAWWNPANTIYDVKSLIGRRFSDSSVQNNIRLLPFSVVSGPNDKPVIMVKYKGEERCFCPEEISSMVLAKIMKDAVLCHDWLDFKDVVITVPAYFNNSQRRVTEHAGRIAGLNVLCIMDEPIAAAVAYRLNDLAKRSCPKYVLVFKLGQGSFDVSLLSMNNGTFKVKAATWNSHLDDDITWNMMKYCIEKFKKQHQKDISGDQRALLKLEHTCEKAKRILTNCTQTTIHVNRLYDSIDFSCCISQAQFDELNVELYKKCMVLVEKHINDAKIEKQSIDEVVLAGNSSKIPTVQYLLQEYFPGKKIHKDIDPDMVVAHGAAIHAAILTGQLGRTDPLLYKSEKKLLQNPLRFTGNARIRVKGMEALPIERLETNERTNRTMSGRNNSIKEVKGMEALPIELLETDERTNRTMSGRNNAIKEVKEMEALPIERLETDECTNQTMSGRNNAIKEVKEMEVPQIELLETDERINQTMSGRDDTIKEVEGIEALRIELLETDECINQTMSGKNDARKEVEKRDSHQFELRSKRDDAIARKEEVERAALKLELSEAQNLIQQLTIERDDARKEVEEGVALRFELAEARKLLEELRSERDDARQEVKELRQLIEQQAPHDSQLKCCAEYSYSELQDATNNFNESFKLGEGGFGVVYKGILNNTSVAIKIPKERSGHGAEDFHQEVEILSKVRHPNLVTLMGTCLENCALIYEYLPNGSLEDHLSCKINTLPLPWQARVRIAFEICTAMSFLHHCKPHGIVHGDLKPDNILLDSNNISKICDFGLCCQLNWTTSESIACHWTECPKGTLAYMDPDYLTMGKTTPQYDVYSFGIILLRIVTCKEPRGLRYVVEEAEKKGSLKTLIDASAGTWPFKEAKKMISLGLRCSDPVRKNRPDLSTEVFKEMKSMLEVASASVSS